MPAGSGGAGCGAKGFAGAAAGVADGAGEGAEVCAKLLAAKPETKTMKAINNWKEAVRIRFIITPLRFFT